MKKSILLPIYSDQCAQLWATSWSSTLIPRFSYGIRIARFALKLNLDKTFPQKNYAKELMPEVLFKKLTRKNLMPFDTKGF